MPGVQALAVAYERSRTRSRKDPRTPRPPEKVRPSNGFHVARNGHGKPGDVDLDADPPLICFGKDGVGHPRHHWRLPPAGSRPGEAEICLRCAAHRPYDAGWLSVGVWVKKAKAAAS